MAAIFQTLERFFGHMSDDRALAWGRWLGRFFGQAVRYHRKDALDALRRAFPGKTTAEARRIANAMYEHLGMNGVESVRLPVVGRAYIERAIEWENIHILKEALKEGRGVLVLTAHCGNWELSCTATPVFGMPITIVVKRVKGRLLNEHVNALRTQFGLKVVPAQNSYRECLRALRRNEILGFVLDQNMTRDEGVFVDFFGRPACTTPGLAHMAARAQVPVVPTFIERLPSGRHLIRTLDPLPPPPDHEPDTLREATQTYTRIIENHIRARPEQWIWIHRRWRTIPLAQG